MEQHTRHDGEWVIAPKEELCLDFANTRYWRGTATPTERLHDWAETIDWFSAAKLVSAPQIAAMKSWFRTNDADAAAAFRDAMALRESLYAIFSATAAQKKPRAEDLSALNRALAASPQRRELRKGAAGYGWTVASGNNDRPPPLLAPMLWSAGDLLVSPRIARVRRCSNEACLWLFLDDSKSGNRRWCSMSACGNRAKAHRHYMRHKDD